MKLYISADIEGIAGITHWDEATDTHRDYAQFQRLFTREVVAACKGAYAAGASEIWLKDAHDTGRNILLEELPSYVKVIRGWSGSPMGMLQELDKSFGGILMIGMHARAGSEANPLAHTLTSRIREVRINGVPASEFILYGYLAEYCGVPILGVSGDEEICAEVRAYNGHIETLAVSKGAGDSTISMVPQASRIAIRGLAEKACRGNPQKCRKSLPSEFIAEVAYGRPDLAYKYSFYPGSYYKGERTIGFKSNDYFEIKRFLQFVSQP